MSETITGRYSLCKTCGKVMMFDHWTNAWRCRDCARLPATPPAGPRVNDDLCATQAFRVLNEAIDGYARREFRVRGISAKTEMPVLSTTQEVWDAIVDGSKKSGNWIDDPKCAGITEYRGCPVEILRRWGVWTQAVPPKRVNDDLCAFGEILVGERPVESPYNPPTQAEIDYFMGFGVEPPLTEEECRDLDGEPVPSGLPVIVAFFVGAIVGVFLAWAFLAIQ